VASFKIALMDNNSRQKEDFSTILRHPNIYREHVPLPRFPRRLRMQDAARAWWTLAVLYGRENVFVLDGGLTDWTRHRLPTTTGRYQQYCVDQRGNWTAKYKPARSRDLAQMTADIREHRRQVTNCYYICKKTYQFTTVCKDDVMISVL